MSRTIRQDYSNKHILWEPDECAPWAKLERVGRAGKINPVGILVTDTDSDVEDWLHSDSLGLMEIPQMKYSKRCSSPHGEGWLCLDFLDEIYTAV